MALKPEDTAEPPAEGIWKPMQKCKVYDRIRKLWRNGQVIEVFEDDGEQCVKVQSGKRTRDIPLNDPDLRSIGAKEKMNDMNQERAIVSKEAKVVDTVDKLWTKIKPFVKDIVAESHELEKEEMRDDLTWYNAMQAVRHELYPAMAVSMSQAVDELVVTSGFAVGDLSEEAVDRVIEVLKNKKILYNKEIDYIRDLIKRANAFRWEESESMFLVHCLFPIQFNHSADSAKDTNNCDPTAHLADCAKGTMNNHIN